MTHPYPLHANRRAPRFRLAETTPAVLQFQDSRLTPGELQVISRTGGLLSLSKPVDQGSVVWDSRNAVPSFMESSAVPVRGARRGRPAQNAGRISVRTLSEH